MKIYNSGGTEILDVQVEDNSFRHRVIMGDHNLTLHYSLAVHVELPVGAYCTFEGQTYTLKRPENLKMKHSRNFEYTVLLESPQADAKIWKFRNTVDGRLKFPLTARPLEHLQMFVANMNRRGSGWTVGTCIEDVEHLISYDHDYCWDALAKMAQEFNTEFEIVGKQVSLKRVEYNKSNPLALSYGKGHGFRSGIARNSSDTMPVEFLFVQGGSENIDRSKYGSSVLLLPKNQSIKYDGEHFEDESGFVAANARQYVVDNLGLSIHRSDKSPSTYAEDSLDCTDIFPKRVGTVSSVVTVDAENNFYDFVDSSIPSTLNYADCQIEGEKLTVIFQSGMLAGHGEFEVNYFHNAVNGKAAKRFEIVPKEEDGYTMPNETFKPVGGVNGDTYAVFKCMLPDAYIRDNSTKSGAEWDMFRAAVRYMFDHEEEIFSFKGELDSLWAKQDWNNIGGKIKLGGYIQFTDSRFQQSGILVRIVGIKDYVNNPHKPELELSNQTQSVGFGAEIKKLESYEVESEEYHRDAINFTKRRFRDAKETMDMLNALIEAGFDNFTGNINPITIQTMQMLVGDESLQYRFVNNTTNPTAVAHNVTYNAGTKKLSAPAGILQHLTLGIKNLSSSHAAGEYKYWNVAAYESAALSDPAKKYYLYVKASKTLTNGVGSASFYLSETPIAMEAVSGYYHFLYGILNSEYEDGRSFVPLYGFSEVLPGRVTTDKVVSGDGNSFFDMLNNAMKLGDMLKFNINGDGKLVLKGTIVQSQGGEDEEVLGCFRGVWNASYVYYVGDEVVYTANNITSYYRCIQQTTAGIAPTNTAYWQVLSAGLRGHFKARAFKRTNTDISSTTPSGGSYDSPTPTGWEDGVPDGTAQLWSTVCTFYSDGTSSGWSHPARETDTDTLDIEFSPSSTAPSAPTGNTPFADHSSEGWYDPNNLPSGQTMIWRAERKVSNGVYDGGWVITRIYGEHGNNGDTPLTAFRWYKDGETVTAPTDTSSDTPSATTNNNASPVSSWSKTAPNRPADGWHLYMTQSTKHTSITGTVTRDAWSTPVRISGATGSAGEDAKEREWIYRKNSNAGYSSTTGTANGTAVSGQTDGVYNCYLTDDFVPTNWSDNPVGVSAYGDNEYATWRDFDHSTGRWGAFHTPIIWSHYGERGMDGDGVEYAFIRSKSSTPPVISSDSSYTDSNGKTYTSDEHLPRVSADTNIESDNSGSSSKLYECTDDPKGTTSTWQYEWVIKRHMSLNSDGKTRSWNYYSGSMSLWAKWSSDGARIVSVFKCVAEGSSPSAPTGSSYPPTGWYKNPPTRGNGEVLWMSQCTISGDGTYGSWSTPVRISGDKGDTGSDGKDIEFIYKQSNSLPSSSDKPANQASTDDYVPTGWTDNPQGVSTTYKYEWMCMRTKAVGSSTWSDWCTPVVWSAYGDQGLDGDGFEYIFKTRTSIWNNPTAPATSQTDDYVPTGWTDDPSGVDSTNQYEYVSMRKKHLGVWGSFSTPSLWAKWSNDGDNGNYIILRYRWEVDKPAQPSGSDPYPANWYDNADREDPTMQYAGSWYGRNGFYYSPKISHEEVTWQKVKFTTTKPNQVVAVDLHVSSETNYDFARVGQLDNAGIINLHPVNDKAALNAQTIAKISGSTSTIVYVEVATEGEHFFYVGYTKDTSSDGGSDQAWFRILKTENMRCWLCQALVDGETGYVDTWGEVIQFIYDNSSEESIYLLSESSTAPSTPTSEPLIEDYVPYLTSEFYSETKSYAVGNKVMYSPYTGYVYAFECIAACTGVAPTNTSYWKQIQTWTDDPQSVTSTYRYQFVSIRRKTNGRWGSFSTPQLYTSYIKGDKGDTGDYFEYRYAVNGSTTTAPALSTAVRNPSGWSTVVPSVGSLQYLWMSVAKINGQTEELLQDWSTPKRVTPVDGTKGDSPALVYRGVYSASASYVGTAYRVDAVKYGNAWYVARTDAGSSFSNVLPTDTSKWNPFGSSFESIATGLLLAENANIAGWIFRNGRLESQKQSNGSPMAFLNGETGEMRLHGTLQLSTAYSGNISDSNLIYLPAKAGSSASYLSMGQEKDDIGKVVRLFNSSAFGGGRYYIEANTFEVEDNGDSTWSMSGTDYTAIVDPQEIIEMTCFERSGSVTGRKKGQWVLTGRFGVDNFKQDAAKGRFPRMIAMGKITGSSSSPSISGTMYNGKSLSTAGFTISRLGEGHYKVSFSSGTLPSGYYVFFTGYGDNWKGSLVNDTSTSFEVKIADDASLNDGSMQFIILDSNNWWYSM